MKKICIVTTRHISYNPRVLKEADTLYAEGYEVTVVTINNDDRQKGFDDELMRSRQWNLKTVDFRKRAGKEKIRWFYLTIKRKAFLFLSKFTFRFGIAERAAEKAFDGLLGLAKKEKAELYLVHHAEALGAGFKAAKENDARFGFDAEDFHTGMSETSTPSPMDPMISYLEEKYLPHCNYMTAASKGIAAAYKDKYGIDRPEVLLNVFPFEKPIRENANVPVKFYWYSQVIGPNRGLEVLLEAAGFIGSPFEIHLRGDIRDQEYLDTLTKLCDKSGVRDRVFFHDSILAERIVSDGCSFDVGLALESDISINRNICVTNKIFSYLMSGLAIIGADTYGQKDIFTHFPVAVRLFRMNEANDLADAMRFYISHPDKLSEAKAAAEKTARERFNWELESEKLLSFVDNVFKKK